ncbi:MAG TPA: BBP7 family outer membrane beta-barrel protein [Planctomycetaceae bacterium]|jgi:hypothetical protein
MRTTVLTLTFAVIGSALIARADGQDQPVAVQSPEAWTETADAQGPEPYSEISLDSPSWIRPRYWFVPPKYGTYFQADVLYLERFHDSESQPIAVSLPPTSATVLTTNSARLSGQWNPGMMYTFGVNLDQIGQIEATYWGLNTWKNTASVTDPSGSLGLAGTLQNSTVDYIFANRMSIDYVSRVNNVELNYKQTINGLTLLAGPRYFRLVETFDINSQSSLFGTSSDYNVSTVNNLIGGQIGVGYTHEAGPLNIGLLGKIGTYANAVHQTTLLQDFGNSITIRNYEKDGMPVSTIGEVQANLSYRLTDWFSIHAGYRFMWIQNLALAPDQLDLSNSPAGNRFLNSHNHLFLQGVNAGAEIRW